MLLTVSLLSKGSFLGSLIHKCRQVVRIKNVKPIETNLKPNISNPPNIDTLQSSIIVNALVSNTNRPASVANISLSSSTIAKNLEQQAGMPPKPKKPLTPFFRFLGEQRSNLLASNPDLGLKDAVKQLSKQWKTTDASLKQRLQEEYKNEKEKYIEQRAKYDAEITDEQRIRLKQLKQKKTDAKESRLMRKRVKELGRPKKPASAFFRFIIKERAVTPQGPKQTYRQWHKQATSKWSSFTEEDKHVYMQESRKELNVYKEEYNLWEEEMIRSGNIDVVRQSKLIDPPERKPKQQ